MANCINIENLSLTKGTTCVFDAVSTGIAEGDRIGVVGLNGVGKSTALDVIANLTLGDSGRVSRRQDLTISYAKQHSNFPEKALVQELLMGDVAQYLWRSNPRIRNILAGLGIDPLLTSSLGNLSGGQRQRVSIASALIPCSDIVLLDEPTNHLDISAIVWLANFLISDVKTCVFVTHDRWFLDTVSTRTWEIDDKKIIPFIGGYNDWIFARAQRERQGIIAEEKRSNLARKELAWLRRGAPARTSKPQYRIAEAEKIISAVPEPRNNVELLQLANRKLGKMVIECNNVCVKFDDRLVLDNITWNVPPGARIGIIGANGTGKSTIFRTLANEQHLNSGNVKHGKTIQLGWLRQELEDIPADLSVLDAISAIATHVDIGDKELSASQVAMRLGFPVAMQQTPIAQLSGGQLKRLQLTRIMMTAPNVLFLDEPTNDLDIDTLQQLEDLLDTWAGTLLVISHDRFFLERVCDDIYTIYNKKIVHLPGGIDQYLSDYAHRNNHDNHDNQGSHDNQGNNCASNNRPPLSAQQNSSSSNTTATSAVLSYAAQKNIRKIESKLEKLSIDKARLITEMENAGTEVKKLAILTEKYERINEQLCDLETQWLELAEEL